MDNKAITAGVRTGGLTDRTEIKILLCYLLASLKQPITQNQLIECVCGQELVNYFEMQSALQHLLDNRLIKEDEQGFSILPEGAEIAQQLESAVNTTVKRYAYTMAVNLLQYEALKKLDPTRFIDTASGWFAGAPSDVESLHVYFKPFKMPKAPTRPVVLSEFGGYACGVKGHIFNLKKTYGYRIFDTVEELEKAIRTLYAEEIFPAIPRGLCGAIYTQLSDVEDETNGLLTYDRRLTKIGPISLPTANSPKGDPPCGT